MWRGIHKEGRTTILLDLNLSMDIQHEVDKDIVKQYECFKAAHTNAKKYDQEWLPEKDCLFFIDLTESFDKNPVLANIITPSPTVAEQVSEKNLKNVKALVKNITPQIAKSDASSKDKIFTIQRVLPSNCLKELHAFQLLRNKNEWIKLKNPVFTWPDKICGYLKKDSDGKVFLYFHQIEKMNKVFNLDEFLKIATDEQINKFADHPLIETNEAARDLIRKSSRRKQKVASLLIKRLTEKTTTEDLKDLINSAKEEEYELPLTNDKTKIYLPEEKDELDDLLDFLNENFFTGSVTKERYRTNSKQPR